MALIKCPECGQMISEYADKCISCGCPMEVIKGLLLPKHIDFKIKDKSLITKLSEEEKEYVLSVVDLAHDNYAISQYSQFISFASKSSNYRSFWIVRPSDGLRYGYKDENDKTHKFKIKQADPKWLININKVSEEEIKKPEASSQSLNFANLFTREERQFVLDLIAKTNNRFPGQFKIENKSNSCAIILLNNPNCGCVFYKQDGKLLFCYKKTNSEDKKTFPVGELDDVSHALILQKIKSVFFNNPFENNENPTEEKIIDDIPQHSNKLYEYIRCEMTRAKYNATPSIKALCRNIKQYLLDVLNAESKSNNRINDTVFISSVIRFYGNDLAWNKKDGERSAKIVYNYFKANTILEKIKDYEDIFKKQIVTDNIKFLNFLYENIRKGLKVEYSLSDSLTPDFALVPEEVLAETLNNFKAYEND